MNNSRLNFSFATPNQKNEPGYVLPLSVLLMFILSISGLNFLHMDFLERRITRIELDNQDAFYLASTGIERARESFKAPAPTYKWTTVLNDPAQRDLNPPAGLCSISDPADPNYSGCVIPPFGASVTSPGLPFSGTFDDGSYQMRAFNNAENTDLTSPCFGQPGTTDCDGKLVYRALGLVRGQQKLLELQGVQTKTGMRLIVCQNDDTSAICPDNSNPNSDIENMEGRDPASYPNLPTWDQSYYRDAGNLPCAGGVVQIPANQNITLTPTPNSKKPEEVKLQSDKCYIATGAGTGSVSINQAGVTDPATGLTWNNIVVFSNGGLTVGSGSSSFTSTILIALSNITLQGSVTLSSPKLPDYYPALISGGSITKGDASVEINGNIFAAGSIGDAQHPWNPNQVTGSITGSDVYLKASSTTVTDNNDENYYDPMPGFSYPPELLTNQSTPGTNSWRELE